VRSSLLFLFLSGLSRTVDRIINHLKLRFVAERPALSQVAFQELLIAGEAGGEYFS